MLETLEATGGIYVAIAVVALVSGVFPIVNSELALIGIALTGATPAKLVVLATIIAAGQTVTHSLLYLSARTGSTRIKRLQPKLDKARIAIARWGDKALLGLFSSATLGLPPMMLVALVAGAVNIRFRTFVLIGLAGRVLRFVGIAVAAALV